MRVRVLDVTVVTAALCAVAFVGTAQAQRAPRLMGPIVESFGGVADVSKVGELDVEVPTDREYKAVFELSRGSSSPERPVGGLEVVGRYLNLHARAGAPRDKLAVAVVVHGGAVDHVMTNEAYREKHGVDNPTLGRLQELVAAGGEVYLCGQSAGFRGMTKDQMAAPVKLAYSAMTVMTTLQGDGYRYISHDWPRLSR